MKLFISKGYHLGNLAVTAKLTYSIFLAFVLIGIWTSWAIYSLRIGPELDGPVGQPSVAERYVEREAAPAASGDGPAMDLEVDLDLEDEAAASDLAAADGPSMKWEFVLDVFHQHVFTVSVVFLILAHLFMLTRLSAPVAGTIVLLSGLSALAHVLAPVLIHVTGGWLWLMPVSGALMGVTWTGMTVYTLLAMWLRIGLVPAAR